MERFVSLPFLIRQNNAGIASYSHIWLNEKGEQTKTQFLSPTSRSLNLSKIL